MSARFTSEAVRDGLRVRIPLDGAFGNYADEVQVQRTAEGSVTIFLGVALDLDDDDATPDAFAELTIPAEAWRAIVAKLAV